MGMPAEEQARKRMTVTVEYDCRGKRVSKQFPTMQAAKSFYVKKDRDGRNPKVVKAGDGKPAKSKPAKSKPATTDKELIFKEWKRRRGKSRRDWRAIREAANAKTVKDSSVQAWVSSWNCGNKDALPRCARK